MEREVLAQKLKQKTELESMVNEVLNEPSILNDLLEIINSGKGSIRFASTKIIRLVSEKNPGIVYPYFGEVADLIHNENSFIKWDAITILSNLVLIDKDSRFDSVYDDYFDLINDPQMITAGNLIGNAWKIILANPNYEEDVTKRLLMVSGITYLNEGEPSPECNNIICGHTIDCFDRYFDVSKYKEDITEFVKSQLNNPRKSVSMKAEKFLKKHTQIS